MCLFKYAVMSHYTTMLLIQIKCHFIIALSVNYRHINIKLDLYTAQKINNLKMHQISLGKNIMPDIYADMDWVMC